MEMGDGITTTPASTSIYSSMRYILEIGGQSRMETDCNCSPSYLYDSIDGIRFSYSTIPTKIATAIF